MQCPQCPQCPQCQHENPEGMKFCVECGAKLERLCPECGFSNSPTNKFCGECGHSLEAAQTLEPKFASPETYTPKYLAERILTSKASLESVGSTTSATSRIVAKSRRPPI